MNQFAADGKDDELEWKGEQIPRVGLPSPDDCSTSVCGGTAALRTRSTNKEKTYRSLVI